MTFAKRILFFFALLLSQAAVASPAAVTVQPVTATAGNFFQVLMGLIVVLGLMAAAAWSLKRFNLAKINGNTPIKVVGGVNVGNRERVLVLEVAGQWIVVGVAAGQVNALTTMPRPEQVATSESVPAQKNFPAWLKQMIDKRNGL